MNNNPWIKLAAVSFAGILISFAVLWGVQQFSNYQYYNHNNMNSNTMMNGGYNWNGMGGSYNGSYNMNGMNQNNMSSGMNMQGNMGSGMNMQGNMGSGMNMQGNMNSGMNGSSNSSMNMQGGSSSSGTGMMDDMMDMMGNMM
jgi:hypothetical protein